MKDLHEGCQDTGTRSLLDVQRAGLAGTGVSWTETFWPVYSLKLWTTGRKELSLGDEFALGGDCDMECRESEYLYGTGC